jgi:hypothetical protein
MPKPNSGLYTSCAYVGDTVVTLSANTTPPPAAAAAANKHEAMQVSLPTVIMGVTLSADTALPLAAGAAVNKHEAFRLLLHFHNWQTYCSPCPLFFVQHLTLAFDCHGLCVTSYSA